MPEQYTHFKISRNPQNSSYLVHHGIAGQKWGKRNGPPYPLDYNDHSAAEKKGDYRFGSKSDKPLKKVTNSVLKMDLIIFF